MGWGESWDKKQQLASQVSAIDTQRIIKEMADYISKLSPEERGQLFDEVHDYFSKHNEFSNKCHDAQGHFCEGDGAGKGGDFRDKLQSVWRDKVPEIAKFNLAFAGLSAKLIMTSPDLKSMVVANSIPALTTLAAGVCVMFAKTINKYTK